MLGLLLQVGSCPSCQQIMGYYCPTTATWCYMYPPGAGVDTQSEQLLLMDNGGQEGSSGDLNQPMTSDQPQTNQDTGSAVTDNGEHTHTNIGVGNDLSQFAGTAPVDLTQVGDLPSCNDLTQNVPQTCIDLTHVNCPYCTFQEDLNAFVCGYQSYPVGHGVVAPPAPAAVPVSAAAVAAATAASIARFTRQPVPLPPTNGTFRPSLPPGTTTANGPLTLRPCFNGTGSRGPSPGFHNSKQFRHGFHKSGGFRAMKRKLSDDAKSDSGDSNGKADSTSGDFQHPLYCKICRVTLNAPAQAKQHYEGKNHSKKVKLYMEGSSNSESNGTSGDQTSGSSNGTPSEPPKEINPEIYCKVCGVSFNSPKQAQQHYQGKNHAKKLRASHQPHPGSPENSKVVSRYGCFVCNAQLTSQEQLDTHLKGTCHAVIKSKSDTSASALRGKWVGKPTGGLANGVRQLPEGSLTSFPSYPSPPAKRTKRDFTMYRTPSGKYYCSSCNVTVGSDMQFAQHVDSRKHKMNNAVKRNAETNNNNAESSS